jgi:hypothetical protein
MACESGLPAVERALAAMSGAPTGEPVTTDGT